MKFKHKNVLVYGMSSSGEWACQLLNKLKANVFVFDDDKEKLEKICNNHFKFHKFEESLLEKFDYIIVSPSIEKDNEILSLARTKGVRILSEMEFACLLCKNVLAVTGTNGKTTTVELITKLLSTKYKTISCGNIGYPVSKAVLKNKKDIKVVEVSSFMLENADTFSPHIATVLNISPDHLIRHKTMEEYVRIKLNIFKNLTTKDYAVINLDDNIRVAKDTKTLTYSQNKIADAYINNGYIYLKDERLIAINQLKLKGKHNLYNILCAILYAYVYKIPTENIREVLSSFAPEKYRIENLGTVNGISFINDSKSTNIASTLASVDTIKGNIILLLGGSIKGLDYSEMFKNLSKRVKQIVCFGAVADEMEQANKDKFKLEKCKDLNSAFKYATEIAQKKDNIILSPASASYDQFENYIERGKFFENLVKEYENIKEKR